MDTGQKAWTHAYDKTPNWGSMLVTGGGVVFTGGTNDRKIHAFDASTGKLLWEYQTSSGIVAPPSTFTRERQAVRGGAGRLGRRPARDAERAQPDLPRRVSAGARGRLDFSLCARLAAARPATAPFDACAPRLVPQHLRALRPAPPALEHQDSPRAGGPPRRGPGCGSGRGRPSTCSGPRTASRPATAAAEGLADGTSA